MDLVTSRFGFPPSSDAGDAVCVCGSVQEEPRPGIRASGHHQQLRMNINSRLQLSSYKLKLTLHNSC